MEKMAGINETFAAKIRTAIGLEFEGARHTCSCVRGGERVPRSKEGFLPHSSLSNCTEGACAEGQNFIK